MLRSPNFFRSLPLVLLMSAWIHSGIPEAQADWKQWRGPLGSGSAPGATPPVEWSESKNVKWKVRIPGQGSATPIVLGDRVFITTAVSTGRKATGDPPSGDLKQAAPAPGTAPTPPSAPAAEGGRENRERRPGGGGRGGRAAAPDEIWQWQLLCLNRNDGKILWQHTAVEQLPHEGHHQDHGFASHSPVTDGKHVYAYFGSRGLHCYTLEGKPVWSKQLGRMQTRNAFGEGSSPLLAGNSIIINWDHEGSDFIAAFDKATGQEQWRKERDEPTSWATPVAVEHGGKTQIIVSATNRIRSYDLADGKVIWECGGMTTNVIPTPIVSEGVVYAISGFRGNALLAIPLGKTGDLTDSAELIWKYETKAPYVPSALLENGRLWFFSQNTGILSCLEAKTGKVLIDAQRVEGLGGVYASPVAADGRIYLIGRNGEGIVLQAGPELKILASNRLDEKFEASPALSGKDIFLRGHEFVYCLTAN